MAYIHSLVIFYGDNTYMKKILIISLFTVFQACDSEDSMPEVELLESINSAVVAFEYQSDELKDFLIQPNKAYISGHFMFEEDLATDVIFGLDIEFLEGVDNPLNFEGADWMGLVGITREGLLWYPTGLPQNKDGVPTDDNTDWQVNQMDFIPKANTWYKIRTEVDFNNLTFVSFSVEGDEEDFFIDLAGEPLDYPNYIPFDKPSVTLYTFSLRSKEFAPDNASSAKVYFDDIEAGIWDGQNWHITFTNSFEEQNEILPLPIELPVIPLSNISEDTWYFENDQAKTSIVDKNARSGSFSLMCDADLAARK